MKALLACLKIDFASPVPVYEQVKRQIKIALARRVIGPNEALPSIRELAVFLKINPNTVARAYRELVQEKVVDSRPGIGFWISDFTQVGEDRLALLQEEFLAFLEKAVEMGIARDDLKRVINSILEGGK